MTENLILSKEQRTCSSLEGLQTYPLPPRASPPTKGFKVKGRVENIHSTPKSLQILKLSDTDARSHRSIGQSSSVSVIPPWKGLLEHTSNCILPSPLPGFSRSGDNGMGTYLSGFSSEQVVTFLFLVTSWPPKNYRANSCKR